MVTSRHLIFMDATSILPISLSHMNISKNDKRLYRIASAVFVLTGLLELLLHRPVFGPDGHFGFWNGSIWNNECSQRFADPYSFSHIVHGLICYYLLWLVMRRSPVALRLLLAVAFECGWEILENSPFIVERFRAANVAMGYSGDSILNSMSDVIMMTLGFVMAWKLKPRIAVAMTLVMEIGCAFWIRDNLTLQVAMLIHPSPVIAKWQCEVQPPTTKPSSQ